MKSLNSFDLERKLAFNRQLNKRNQNITAHKSDATLLMKRERHNISADKNKQPEKYCFEMSEYCLSINRAFFKIIVKVNIMCDGAVRERMAYHRLGAVRVAYHRLGAVRVR